MNTLRPCRWLSKTRYSLSVFAANGSRDKMRISELILDSVMYLYPTVLDAQQSKHVGGSGFLFCYASVNPALKGMGWHYVATNSHVVDEGNRVIAMKSKEGGIIPIATQPDDWHFAEGDDLALYPIPGEYLPQLNAAGHACVKLDQMITRESIEEADIGIGDEIAMPGRFVYHQGRQTLLPAARFGNIAMMPFEPVYNEYLRIDQESFLVDIYAIAGFSGSPVWIQKPYGTWKYPKKEGEEFRMTTRPYTRLLGIQSMAFVDRQPVTEPDPERLFKYRELGGGQIVEVNTGISVVIPAWKLSDFFFSDELVAHRKRDEGEIMEKRKREQQRREGGGARLTSLPYPESDLSPHLQRTIKRKIESGEDEGVDPDEFSKLLGRMTPPEQSDPED